MTYSPDGGMAGIPTSTVLVTSADGAYWNTTAMWTEVASATADVTIQETCTGQTWQGFGGAFNEKGWDYLTTPAMKDQAIQLLFGADGCHLAWGRIPMGSSDFGIGRYTDDEVASGSTDYSMASFSISRDMQYLIPFIKAAQAANPALRFWASPWTPPTWMKTWTETGMYSPSTGRSNSPFDGGIMKNDDATFKAHAQYFVKFVQAYAAQGINIEFVAPQNEPNYEQNYPSCHWDTADIVKFVGSYLGPALAAANLPTKVMDGTLSNPDATADLGVGTALLMDPTAKGYIGAIGVQYGMSGSSQIQTLQSLAGPGIPVWLTEHQCGGNIGSTAPAPNDSAYGVQSFGLILAAIESGVTAYNAWNMVLDRSGLGLDDTRVWAQNAPLVADSGSVIETPTYYAFRHFAQFAEPGATVLGTVLASPNNDGAVGFKNPDGSLVAVMNHSGAADPTYTVSIGGRYLQFPMPANGWATVKVSYSPATVDAAAPIDATSGGSPEAGAEAADAMNSADAMSGVDAASGADASPADASVTMEAGSSGDAGSGPASCAHGGAGMTNCGAASESCCTSLAVMGGTYDRTYTYTKSTLGGQADPATVSNFRLDKYLVTVGRFRQFVSAWNKGNGWMPPQGSGTHSYLPGGGLANTAGGYETGWDATDWNNTTDIDPTDANLDCGDATWTSSAGAQENLPINCANWWEAYAFCIWDGGFLPSEAESEYAAAGGSQMRQYPWGTTDPGTSSQYAIFAGQYTGNSTSIAAVGIAPVGTATLGAGVWGQLDLGGELWEWNLDSYDAYVSPCTNCANFGGSDRVLRGGDFTYTAALLLPSTRYIVFPSDRNDNIGFRCARMP